MVGHKCVADFLDFILRCLCDGWNLIGVAVHSVTTLDAFLSWRCADLLVSASIFNLIDVNGYEAEFSVKFIDVNC